MTTETTPAAAVAHHIESVVALPPYASLEVHVSCSGERSGLTRQPHAPPAWAAPAGGHRSWRPLAELYCAAKPLVATGVLALAPGSGVDIDEPVAGILGELGGLDGHESVAALLCHDTNLRGPSGMEWMCTPVGRRDDQIFARSTGPCYSEVAGGRVVELAWYAVTGRRLDDDLAEKVFAALGNAEVVLDGGTAASVPVDRFEVELAPSTGGPVPLLHVCVEEYRRRTSAAFSGWASCRGYHDALEAIVEERGPFGGVGSAILAGSGQWASAASGRRHDALLGKPVGFRSGFMVVAESAGIAPSPIEDLLVTNAGLAQKVSVVSAAESLVVTAWTNLNVVADVESLVFRDAVVGAAHLALSELSPC